MGSLAPTARGQLVAPFLIGFGARPLRVGCLCAFFIAPHSEGVHGIRIRLEFSTYVARFGIA
eukprot:4785998-Pleurochrysis_carterae.AAC.3